MTSPLDQSSGRAGVGLGADPGEGAKARCGEADDSRRRSRRDADVRRAMRDGRWAMGDALPLRPLLHFPGLRGAATQRSRGCGSGAACVRGRGGGRKASMTRRGGGRQADGCRGRRRGRFGWGTEQAGAAGMVRLADGPTWAPAWAPTLPGHPPYLGTREYLRAPTYAPGTR